MITNARLAFFLTLLYATLFVLSIGFIVPYCFSGESKDIIVSSFLNHEPEYQSDALFLLPLVWVIVPILSLILAFTSWILYKSSSIDLAQEKIVHVLAAFLIVVSFIPAAFTIRELLIYQSFQMQVWLNGVPSLIQSYTNLTSLITTVGYLGLFIIIFAESGLFVGFFLPGDSLLFTAGILSGQNLLNISLVIILTISGAILGDNFGYFFGRRVGVKLFNRENSLLFRRENIERVRTFYERHGPKSILLARFVPIARTFAPILAGMGGMTYKVFLAYNIVGGVLWGSIVPVLGFYIGRTVPDIQIYLYPVIALIILISILPWIVALVNRKLRAVFTKQ